MDLKLDMLKTYHKLECDFVVEVLTLMGFPKPIVSLIRRYVSSVSYHVLINGQPNKGFLPEMGFSKAISPYLIYSFCVLMFFQVC